MCEIYREGALGGKGLPHAIMIEKTVKKEKGRERVYTILCPLWRHILNDKGLSTIKGPYCS